MYFFTLFSYLIAYITLLSGMVNSFCHSFQKQKSPAKKLSHAISKSLGCVPSREPPRPVFPEQPEKPLDLAHIV